jgi:hypothetical protein
MAWSGGTYTKGNNSTGGWTGDASVGIGIEAGRHDTQDNDFATGINTCIAKDGQNAATADLPMGGFKHTNVANATARNNYAAVSQVQDNSLLWGGTSGGAANAQTLTLAPIITAYAAGQRYSFLAGFTNTAAATLNINGVGAKNIFNTATGAAIGAGEIVATRAYEVIYDGTQFLLLNDVTPIQNGDYIWLGTTGGTATAMTASATPAITAYKAGQKFRMLTGTASTGTNVTAHTLNVNGLGAKSIKTSQGAIDPTIGDWVSSGLLELIYDGTVFRIINAAGAWATYTPTLTPTGGTASSISFVTAVYQKYSRICNFHVYVTWTQGTATAANVAITLPIASFYNNLYIPSMGTRAAATTATGFALTSTGGTVVNCYNYDQAVFAIGGNTILLTGSYITA